MSGPVGPVGVALAGHAALAAALGIGRFVYTPILPEMIEAADLSTSQAGLIASANFAGYLIGALLAAAPGLPGKPRDWLIGGLAASAATTAAMALPSGLMPFLSLRLLGGVASAFVLVYASALVLEGLASAGRHSLSALHFAGVGTGIALSAALVELCRAAETDWRTLWLVSGTVPAAAVPVVIRAIPVGAPETTPPATAADLAPPTKVHGFPALVAAYGLFGFGYIVTATFLVSIVRASPAAAALEPVVWLVVGLTAAPSVAIWRWVAERVGLPRAFAIACAAEGVGVAASVLWPDPVGMVMAASLLGGTFMGLTALGLITAQQLAAGDPARALALMTAAFGTGQIVGPSFAGLLNDQLGSFLIPSLTAAVALLVAAALSARIARPCP